MRAENNQVQNSKARQCIDVCILIRERMDDMKQYEFGLNLTNILFLLTLCSLEVRNSSPLNMYHPKRKVFFQLPTIIIFQRKSYFVKLQGCDTHPWKPKFDIGKSPFFSRNGFSQPVFGGKHLSRPPEGASCSSCQAFHPLKAEDKHFGNSPVT